MRWFARGLSRTLCGVNTECTSIYLKKVDDHNTGLM